MAKILVADDNSNVQKTVALALADLGIEVVAVNNGEAAVRKLADVMPDIVLADIFMPVRDGYEVCEYVKKDSRFSHMPVVLLVGAFDPLDEREAQRVGADGILKKPFVPPDPLIAMVKTLLDRTLGERLVTAAVSKPTVSMQSKAGGVAVAEERSSTPQIAEESSEAEFPPPMERLSFGDGEHPVAFSQLLDNLVKESATAGTGVADPADNEHVLTSSRDASLGNPIFWRTEEPEPEAEAESAEAGENSSTEIPLRGWSLGEESLFRAVESKFEEAGEPSELVRDERDEESSQTSTIVELTPLLAQDAALQASLNVEAAKPEDLAANPIEWMASVPPPPAEETPEAVPEWSAAVPEVTDPILAKEADLSKSALEPVALESPATLVFPVSTSSPAMPSPPVTEEIAALPQSSTAAKAKDPLKTQPSLKPFAQSAEDTARSISKLDWADMAANLQPRSAEPDAEKSKTAPTPAPTPVEGSSGRPAVNEQRASISVASIPEANAANAPAASANPAPPAAPDPALVEAVVQRVLDKMRPQVVDIITKEFLRPVVQALVHREITKR